MKSLKTCFILLFIAVNVLSASNIRISRQREGEHIIIAPEEFISLANQLADFYLDEFGIERIIVDQQDIFDQMNNGVADPQAIRDYLIIFFDDPLLWENSSVLLLGSGTQDWSIPCEKNKIIVFDYSDDNFVDFDNDLLLEIPIGRIPAQNIQQLEFYLNRMYNYITQPELGWWKNKMLIVADDEYKNGQLEGIGYNSGMNHTARAQDASEVLNDGVRVDKILGIEYPMNAAGYKPEAAQDIISALNEGRLVWYYIGHGSISLLGDEKYFELSNLSMLNNADKLPLFLAGSPNVGKFFSYPENCMSEEFLFAADGGAIACISATMGTSPTPNALLLMRLLENIINSDDYVGHALWDAKQNSTYWHIYNNHLYNLLGDPLQFINPPESDELLVINGNPDTLYIGDDVQITGQVEPGNFNIASIKSFESEYELNYTNTLGYQTYTVDYTKFGTPYFEEEVAVSGDYYESYFTIPQGIQTGENARIISYLYNGNQNIDYVQYCYPIIISDGYANASGDIIELIRLSLRNYPNPFNPSGAGRSPSTTISFSLNTENTENTELIIYNIKGQKIRTFENLESASPSLFFADGHGYSITWDGTDENNLSVGSGVYLYKLKLENQIVATKKMMLMK